MNVRQRRCRMASWERQQRWLLALSVLAAHLSFPGPSLAQVAFGVLGGANGSVFSGDTPPRGTFKFGAGYQFGGSVGVSVGPHIVLGVEALYVSASPNLEIKIDPDDANIKKTLHFDTTVFAVPITARYEFGERDKTRAFVGTGAQLGFLLSATLREEGLPDIDLQDDLESLDVSVLLDLGVKSRFRWLDWFIQGRIAIGLVDVAKGDVLLIERDVIWKTRSTVLLAGLSYSFGD